MNLTPPAAPTWRLALARACAWALLLAGWVGIGSVALHTAASAAAAFGWVALWLLALGAAATLATRGPLPAAARTVALAGAAALTAAALLAAAHGGGAAAVLAAAAGWAVLTALASGVVRALRLTQAQAPRPPVAAASAGALCAALVLGDIGDVAALALRLAVFVAAVAVLLAVLPQGLARRGSPGCRAGLFDCSLPAWPTGAWRDPGQWPVLLAGVAMLPMMAALPLMADWCRAANWPAAAVVLLHLAAMFAPAWLLQDAVSRWSPRRLAQCCTLLLVAGALGLRLLPSPWDWLGLALSHGAAWGLAWTGQLWAPARRGQQGSSPLRAAFGYAALTLAFGLLVQHSGPAGLAQVHQALGAAAALAWLARALRPLPPPAEERPTPG